MRSIRKILTVGVLTFGLFACDGDDIDKGAELNLTMKVTPPITH